MGIILSHHMQHFLLRPFWMRAGNGSSSRSPSLLSVRFHSMWFNAVQFLLGFYLNNVLQVFRFWLQAHITSNKHIVFIAR
jgi:hypothetical protein